MTAPVIHFLTYTELFDIAGLDRSAPDDTHGLRRLLHALRHDPEPELTAALDAAETANISLDAAAELVSNARPFWCEADAGTRATISGGEVLEIDAHLEARYEERFDTDF